MVDPVRRGFLLPGRLRGRTEAWNSISGKVKGENAISDHRILVGDGKVGFRKSRLERTPPENVNSVGEKLRIELTAVLSKRYAGFAHLPGDNSETGVLDGVGLCPGGRKCDGDPLLEPPPGAGMEAKQTEQKTGS